VGYQLFVPRIVGLANNGGFSRVAEPLGIFPAPEIGNAAFFDWIVPQYRFDPNLPSGLTRRSCSCRLASGS